MDKGNATVRVDRVFLQTTRACPRILSLTVARHSETVALPTWLDQLPHADSLCAHICLKGMLCDAPETMTALRALRMTVHSCVEEPGGSANGHEGVCAFRFLLDNYRKNWEHVFYMHGDAHMPKHTSQFASLKRYLTANEWPKWPRRRSEMTSDICGCGWLGVRHSPFGPRDFWYNSITWWLGNFVELADPTAAATAEQWATHAECSRGECSRAGLGAYLLNNGTWLSPLGFMFAVDKAAATQRSQAWLRAQYRMNKFGVRSLSPGMHHARRAARLPAPGFDYAPLPWAHVNERLPYVLFGYEFKERPVPPCVLVGDHADQNCSFYHLKQGKATVAFHPQPEEPGGCRPRDAQCGSVTG